MNRIDPASLDTDRDHRSCRAERCAPPPGEPQMSRPVETIAAAGTPVGLICGNLVVARDATDAWAVYRLQTDRATRRAGAGGRRQRANATVGTLAEAIGTDFSILRIERPWSLDDYAMGVEAIADIRYVRRDLLSRCLEAQRAALEGLRAHTVEVFLSVRLSGGAGSPDERLDVDGLLAVETTAFQAVIEWDRVRRVTAHELAWLIRRGFRRGLGYRDADEPGRPRFELDCEIRRDGPHGVDARPKPPRSIETVGRSLRIASELGYSHQSFLEVQALPPSGAGGADALLDLLQTVDFPIDAALTMHRANDPVAAAVGRAQAGVRLLAGSVVDGRSAVQASLSLCVSASSVPELERRVVRLRRMFAGVRLHRPEDQLELFHSHFPVGPYSVAGSALPAERVGALRLASSAVGSGAGAYVGHIPAGAPRPVLFNPRERAGSGAPAGTLLSGAARSGKTVCMQLIMYQAFTVGSVVIDVDPKGDHALERLPDAADHVEVLELSATRRFAGLLDPLRIGPFGGREQLAVDFLIGVLPPPVPPEWRQEVEIAVRVAAGRGSRTCAEVVDELDRRGPHARAAARAIRRHATEGLAALGFGRPGETPPEPGREQITSLRIRDLRLQEPAKTPTAASPEEQVGSLVLRLLAAYGLQLAREREESHCLLGLDQAAALMSDAAGRDLIDLILLSSRTANFTPLVATRAIDDPEWLEERFGAVFCFRLASESQLVPVSRLLRCEADSGAVAHELLTAGPGRCLMRDYRGRVGRLQVDFADDRLLPILDTTPAAPFAGRGKFLE